MATGIATIGVILLVLLAALAGLRDGVFFTTYALLRNCIAFICAMSFSEPLARLLEKLFTDAHPAEEYFLFIAFAAICGAVFALGRFLKVTFTAPQVPCHALVDKAGGVTLGALNGVVVTGLLLVMWSLVPFAKYIPGDHGRVHIKSGILDTGAMMLKFYKRVEQGMGGSAVFLLDDEPIVEDLNNNGRADPGETFRDMPPANGRWDRGWLWKYRHQGFVLPGDLEVLGRQPGPS